jgi:acetyl-CoA acetyltransferase
MSRSSNGSDQQGPTTSLSDFAADVAIAGIGESELGRRLEADLLTLIIDAIVRATDDAGIRPSDIDGIVSDTMLTPALAIDVAMTLGLPPETFVAHLGCSGAGVVAAPMLAGMALRHGLATNIVTFTGLKVGSEAGSAYSSHLSDPYKGNLELPYGFFPQAAYMAAMASRYLWEYGYTPDDLGQVPMAEREWASLNATALKRDPLTLEKYHASPMVADPFRVVDCAMNSDGAAAYVMTTRERARDLQRRPVDVASCVWAREPLSFHGSMSVRPDNTTIAARFSGPPALERAGVAPADVDFAELYDCFSIIPVIQLEDLGLAQRGEALGLYVKGETRPGGSLPVNTHGGLMAHSFLISANHVCEAVRQLRGEAGAGQVPDAEVGVVTGWGTPEHSTLVLSRS